MAIKNKDGSPYRFTKPVPEMAQQSFWNKKESITVHNKYGERYLRERNDADEIDLSKIKREVELPEVEEIKIVQAIEEPKPKQLSEEIVEIWCLPCVGHIENVDPLYDESYDKINYGGTFIFKSRLLSLEDLSIQFITEMNVNLPNESVVYPKTASRRWWRIKGMKEVEGFKIYVGVISDYQPSFG
jgi:hypothetical protein